MFPNCGSKTKFVFKKRLAQEIESGWWLNHPLEKYARRIGSSPQVRVKIKKGLKPPP